MAKKKSLLERMRANPQNDWTIENIETLCSQVGLVITKPKGGSHYHVFSEFVSGMQPVPYRRPIKSIYIKRLVSLSDVHLRRKNKMERGS